MNTLDNYRLRTLDLKGIQTLTAPLALTLVGAFMAAISWGKWSDIILDYGEPVYVAWRLSEGDLLYKDITFFHGLLSPYINALLFRIFGTGIQTLIWFNLGLVALTSWLIYRIFAYMGSRLSAFWVTLVFLSVFAFSQYLWMGNHNFICSYVYGITHGAILCFIGLWIYICHLESPRNSTWFVFGLISGLIFLSKFEVSLAWLVTAGAIVVGHHFLPGTPREHLAKALAGVIFGALIPLGVFLIYFLYRSVPLSESVSMLFKHWLYVFDTSVNDQFFYQSLMGRDAPLINLQNMFILGLGWLGVFILLAGLNHWVHKISDSRRVVFGMGTIVVAGIIVFLWEHAPWLYLLRPLPAFLMIFLIWAGYRRFIRNRSRLLSPQKWVELVLALFSLLLLTKILLKTHVYHYGSVLALPGTLLLIKFLVDDVSRALETRSSSIHFYRGSVIALTAIFILAHVKVSVDFYEMKGFPVGKPPDQLIGYNPWELPRDMMFQIALDIAQEKIEPEASLMTLPIGNMLNYLARRPSPNPNMSFNPGTASLIGEQSFLESLQARPPDYIFLIYYDFMEYKQRFFGRDFGTRAYAWIQDNYSSFRLIGRDPVKGEGFGIHILKRKPATPEVARNETPVTG